MILYEKQDNKVLIHELIADKKTLQDFRYQEIKSFADDEREYNATLRVFPFDTFFSRAACVSIMKNKDDISLFLEKPYKLENFNIGEPYRLLIPSNTLLEKYYQGYYDQEDSYYNEALGLNNGNNTNYFLLTKGLNSYEDKKTFKRYNTYTIKGMLHLTEPLFILYLIQHQRFSLIPYEQVSKKSIQTVLDLYSHNIIDEIDLEHIKKLDTYHLGKDIYQKTYQEITTQAKKTSRILTYIKQK